MRWQKSYPLIQTLFVKNVLCYRRTSPNEPRRVLHPTACLYYKDRRQSHVESFVRGHPIRSSPRPFQTGTALRYDVSRRGSRSPTTRRFYSGTLGLRRVISDMGEGPRGVRVVLEARVEGIRVARKAPEIALSFGLILSYQDIPPSHRRLTQIGGFPRKRYPRPIGYRRSGG